MTVGGYASLQGPEMTTPARVCNHTAGWLKSLSIFQKKEQPHPAIHVLCNTWIHHFIHVSQYKLICIKLKLGAATLQIGVSPRAKPIVSNRRRSMCPAPPQSSSGRCHMRQAEKTKTLSFVPPGVGAAGAHPAAARACHSASWSPPGRGSPPASGKSGSASAEKPGEGPSENLWRSVSEFLMGRTDHRLWRKNCARAVAIRKGPSEP